MKVFEKPGSGNTEAAVRIALERAIAFDAPIVAPTTKGSSAVLLLELAKELGFAGKITIVTHAFGSKQPGENQLAGECRAALEQGGATLVTAAHVLSGAERGISSKFSGTYPVEIIAHSLRMLSHGVKVAVEVSCMALDAGAIPYGVPVVAMGGTERGLDTAVVMSPSHAGRIFETKLHEILCMPY